MSAAGLVFLLFRLHVPRILATVLHFSAGLNRIRRRRLVCVSLRIFKGRLHHARAARLVSLRRLAFDVGYNAAIRRRDLPTLLKHLEQQRLLAVVHLPSGQVGAFGHFEPRLLEAGLQAHLRDEDRERVLHLIEL